jgi:hypothetical protein
MGRHGDRHPGDLPPAATHRVAPRNRHLHGPRPHPFARGYRRHPRPPLPVLLSLPRPLAADKAAMDKKGGNLLSFSLFFRPAHHPGCPALSRPRPQTARRRGPHRRPTPSEASRRLPSRRGLRRARRRARRHARPHPEQARMGQRPSALFSARAACSTTPTRSSASAKANWKRPRRNCPTTASPTFQRRRFRQVRLRRWPRVPFPPRLPPRRLPGAQHQPHRRPEEPAPAPGGLPPRLRKPQPLAYLLLIGPETQPAYARPSASSSPPRD